MPDVKVVAAAERIAAAIEAAGPGVIGEIASDILDLPHGGVDRLAHALATAIRAGVEPELLVDLWNVVFPEDHDVWFNEETDELHYDSKLVESAD